MSDEPTLPSLRLKPRQPLATGAPAPVAPPADSAAELPLTPEADPLLNDPLRLRIKPKAPPPEGSPADTSGSTPLPFSAPPIPPASSNPPPAPAPVSPIPSVPLPPVTPPYVPPPKPQYMQTPRDVADPAYATAGKNSPPVIKADKWLAGLVLLLLLVAVGIYSVRQLTKSHQKAQANAGTSVPIAPAAPTPSAPKLVDKPTSAAGQAIAKARDLVAAREKQEKEQGVTGLLEEPATTDVAKTTSTSSTVASATTSPEAVAPVVAQPVPPPPVSDAFKQFVVNLRVNGVFQGENPRAMLNGKMYHPGDIVEPKLGISLLKIEVEAKQIVFRDADGAILPRHY